MKDIIDNENNYNIGFLYSYDSESNDNNDNKEVHLIDGQQRFTTLYLTLFYLYVKCGKLNNNKEIFKKFSYRVRNLTKEFINIMIDKVKTVDDLHNIENKTWYLSVYRKDQTIKNIVNFFTIFSDENFTECLRKNLEKLENTTFWYFNTSQTSQGEELYITMNSRGEQIASYEDARVILLEEVGKKDKLEKSKIFNDIEHLFWKHRKEGEDSADKGFERFLQQIIGLKKLEKPDKLENNTIGIIEKYKINEEINNIKLEEVIEYYCCLKILFKALDFYKENNYKKYIKLLYDDKEINNYILDNSFFIIIILYIIKKIFLDKKLNKKSVNDKNAMDSIIKNFDDFDNLFQWIRFIYNIKYNYYEDRKSIVKVIEAIKDCEDANIFESLKKCYSDIEDNKLSEYFLSYDGKIENIVKNEILKIKLLHYVSNDNFKDLQEKFWELEEHPVLKGNINYIIKYTLELENVQSNINYFTEEFNLYKNIFESCFELIKDDNSNKMFIKVLLIKAIVLENNKKTRSFFESHAIRIRWSKSYSVDTFSLCNEEEDWSKSFQNRINFYNINTNKVYEFLFKELKDNNIQNLKKYFEKTIEDFINLNKERNIDDDRLKNYFYDVIDENYKLKDGKSILDYSKNKYFAYNINIENIYVLHSENFRYPFEEY